jgi:hypothetical protein
MINFGRGALALHGIGSTIEAGTKLIVLTGIQMRRTERTTFG